MLDALAVCGLNNSSVEDQPSGRELRRVGCQL